LVEPLLDLLDAVEQSLDGLDPQSPHAQGLRISRDKTLERLTHAGFISAPTSGPHDPSLHQVIEVIPSPDAAHNGQLCRTFRRGWSTLLHGQRRIVRPAHVSVYAAHTP
jgi:molecular chaperone GrpE (heat shock protein)